MEGSQQTTSPVAAAYGSASDPINLSDDGNDDTGRAQKRRRGNTGLYGSARRPRPTMTATATVYKHELTSNALQIQERVRGTSDDQTPTPARTTVLRTTELLELIIEALTPGVRLLSKPDKTKPLTRIWHKRRGSWVIPRYTLTTFAFKEVQVDDAAEIREPTLRIMRLVCRRFRDVVDASPRLQKRLEEVFDGKDKILYVID